jgi:hypothetical protein
MTIYYTVIRTSYHRSNAQTPEASRSQGPFSRHELWLEKKSGDNSGGGSQHYGGGVSGACDFPRGGLAYDR